MSSRAVSQTLINLGEGVRKQRQHKHLSQEGLAELAGISSNTVSRIEGGQTAMSVEIFQRLVQVLELDANQLLMEEECGGDGKLRLGTEKYEELFARYMQLQHRDRRIVADTVETLIGGLEKAKT